MKKSTGKMGAERSGRKAGGRTAPEGDALAALEQQRRDVEELIERFDSGAQAQRGPDDEPDGEPP